ncbi:16S rRNA (cytosine(1402)-N(4))-methyltransferase RsmH [Pigmentibacter ruber]|uniref:16S rRNA (cytosine(1402)-N(4))-methyltransferase RsmH n=1 Tax=Pigmentibacter ruber TaxID=2683196 RepID=UPI00131D7BF2|nr:16S rRNA (cytosine(1402)-N(4))-methyltransferase RsmH [Pigmentibacter ruber]
MNSTFKHFSVLKNETIINILPTESLLHYFKKNSLETINFVDATLGGGGHAEELLKKIISNPELKNFKKNFIFFDQDINAIDHASKKLKNYSLENENLNIFYENSNFRKLKEILNSKFKGEKIHSLYADFGVSSPQLDIGQRGFSIMHSGPLDMRMDVSSELTAKKILQLYSEEELTKIFFDYGEEPKARKLAKAIVTDRKKDLLPLENTTQFADYVKRVLSYPNSRVHPATRTFQALRIEVNQELESIQNLLADIPKIVSSYAKVGFISFHSLEDRLVKHAMRNWQKGKNADEKMNTQKEFHLPLHMQLLIEENNNKGFGKEIPRGGITASNEECNENSRSRSARLRCFEFSNIKED